MVQLYIIRILTDLGGYFAIAPMLHDGKTTGMWYFI